MRPPDEDVYVTVVVVRRPALGDSPELDPNALAQSVIRGIQAQESVQGYAFPGSARPRWAELHPGYPRVPTGGWQGAAHRVVPAKRPWHLLALAIACFAGAAVCFYMLGKQG